MNPNLILNKSSQRPSRLIRRQKTKLEKESEDLLSNIAEAKRELDTAAKNINFVSDTMLLDHFTFKLKAAEVRYRYLVAKAKEMGLEQHMYAEKMYKERYYK